MSGSRTGNTKMKTLLILLYIWKGGLKLDTIPMKDFEDCQTQGPVISEKIMNDPKFEQGLFATCIDMPPNMKVAS